MHRRGPLSTFIDRPRVRMFGASLAALGVVIGAFIATSARETHLSASFQGASGFERSQATQTMSALGYTQVSLLEKREDGSWRARAQKNGTQYHVRISPYGIVSAQTAPQLGIVLE